MSSESAQEVRKDKYQVELRVVNGGIERIHRAKRYEEQSALSGRSQESLDLSRAESMVALDKHKPWQASTILVPAKLLSSAPRLLAGDPEQLLLTSADLCSHRVPIFAWDFRGSQVQSGHPSEGQDSGYGGLDWGARSLLMPDGARTGVLGHC